MIIAITRSDGGVSIMRLVAGADPTEAVAKWEAVNGPAVSSREIPDTVIPTDRTFRDAWQHGGTSIDVDMPKARAIHAEKIAVAQTAEIARLKPEERKERLMGNTAQANQHAADTTALEALNLGALATQIQNAATPNALKAIWPAKVPKLP